MDGRLASIEELLRSLASQASPTAKPDADTPTTTTTTTTIGSQINDGRSPLVHSVGTGPSVDLVAAKELFEKTVRRTPNLQQSVVEALQALQGIVGRLDVDAEITQSATLPQRPIHVAPPDWPQVAVILEKSGAPACGAVNWAFPCISTAEFAHKVRTLYERQHKDTPTRRLLVYAGLFGLCGELSALESASETTLEHAKYYYDLSQIFQHLILKAVADLPLILPQSKESVEALVAGSLVAVDMCKPSLSWTLAASALSLAQTLGYHRYSTLLDDSEEVRASKIILFWFAYMQDRGLALRLGRAPAFQDSYISLPKPTASSLVPKSLLPMLIFWIDTGTVQGEICERLYSPAAASQPSEQRSRIARELADRMEALWQTRKSNEAALLQYFSDYSTNVASLMVIGDKVMYLGTMTLALHAIAPMDSRLASEALDYARKFLTEIRDIAIAHCKNAYTWTMYCHWVLLNSPLTPFTVIFCEVISHHQNSTDDLQLMRSYVASLFPACQLSTGVQKFYDLCSVFLRVAEAYTAAKIAEDANRSEDAGFVTGEFDEYLSSLGLAPFPQVNDVASETSAHLHDWFTGNASLYGLLDMGISGVGNSGDGMGGGVYQ